MANLSGKALPTESTELQKRATASFRVFKEQQKRIKKGSEARIQVVGKGVEIVVPRVSPSDRRMGSEFPHSSKGSLNGPPIGVELSWSSEE
jgi:hypothetical protein